MWERCVEFSVEPEVLTTAEIALASAWSFAGLPNSSLHSQKESTALWLWRRDSDSVRGNPESREDAAVRPCEGAAFVPAFF